MKHLLLAISFTLLFASCIKQQETPTPIEERGNFGFPCLCPNGTDIPDTVYCHFAYYAPNRPGDNCRACCANLTFENPNL